MNGSLDDEGRWKQSPKFEGHLVVQCFYVVNVPQASSRKAIAFQKWMEKKELLKTSNSFFSIHFCQNNFSIM